MVLDIQFFLKNLPKSESYQVSDGMGSGDGGMTTGTGMARDFPGTWSLDNFLRGGTEKKTNADGKNQL